MFIPNGLTEEEIFRAIDKISNVLSKRFAFACYTSEDLKQQCFVWAIDGLTKYEEGRPLENFLQVLLKNKLRNLRRDKLRRPQAPCKECEAENFCNDGEPCSRHLSWVKTNKTKTEIMYPINIDSIDEEQEESLQLEDDHKSLEYEELNLKIADRLPSRLRADYLRMIDGAHVSSERRRIIKEEVRNILAGDFDNGEI